MSALLIIGSTVLGAGVGGVVGAWYGFATDRSDFPLLALFTTPAGALVGGLIGVVAGAVLFA